MHRLLIVDDEDIITDGLYEVMSNLMPDQLDVCKAYSAKEALNWMSRTRIDIVMTDIAMPGMNGLELSEEILMYWPRCKVIFLTGHSEFDYAYRAFQMPNVRYLLKTEGYAKVVEAVSDTLSDIHRSNLESKLLEQSREQMYAYEFMAQGDYMRHLLQESDVLCAECDELVKEFHHLNIPLDPTHDVILVLARLSYPVGVSYTEKSKLLAAARTLLDSFLNDQTSSIGIVDKYGDILWMIQPVLHTDEDNDSRFLRYLEGMLELVQEACLASLGLEIALTICSASCQWVSVTQQYERLRRLQQLKIGDGISMILRDHNGTIDFASKESYMPHRKVEIMSAHLEAGRGNEFYAELEQLTNAALQQNEHAQRLIEVYYSVALILFSSLMRLGIQNRLDDHGKLMRLDDHASMKEGFSYLKQTAEDIFRHKHSDERDRASQVIDRICQYIGEHLREDLSLVRLAEIHFFNPSYLSRFFKQERGINLSEYIDNSRARKAKELLQDSDLKVREVAAAVGYEAAYSFTRFFKKVTGMTPQEFRDTLSAN
ncbi:two-component system response regulator YesN [Paenibacillus endophyticus]|uniref:Two-component system response regulator YesN n=1 Tax=Paenibacillus endophyticus TaxID=1294268 RepID=A0A7W5C3Y5_9BACL|nr:helix-turn-helix domain-containing protein [Paenibacillus endophyticus]MBB3150442.1 two-component system response regulator YesN [Paenibacillus endophyticus]